MATHSRPAAACGTHLLPDWLKPRFLSSALSVTTVSFFHLRCVPSSTADARLLLCSPLAGEMVALAAAEVEVTLTPARGVAAAWEWIAACACARREPADSRRRSMVRRICRESMVARDVDQWSAGLYVCLF